MTLDLGLYNGLTFQPPAKASPLSISTHFSGGDNYHFGTSSFQGHGKMANILRKIGITVVSLPYLTDCY